jgi:hexokinase
MSEELLKLRKNLIEDGFILDLDETDTLSKLRRERNRIKETMDAQKEGRESLFGDPNRHRQRMMLWSGIPFPEKQIPAMNLNSQGRHLVVSVGGTNTYFMVMELKDGKIIAFENGKPHQDEEIEILQKKNRMATPHSESTQDIGKEKMINPIVEAIYPHLTHTAHQCKSIILNWAYSQTVKQDGAGFFDISTTTRMEKGQEGFSDLMGTRVEEVFKDAIAEKIKSELRNLEEFDESSIFQMGIHLLSKGEVDTSAKNSDIKNCKECRKKHLENLLDDILSKPKITVANDTIMALHYFLTGENLQTYDQIGLFVNGTGANFTIAENYLVDNDGKIVFPDRINIRPACAVVRGLNPRTNGFNPRTNGVNLPHIAVGGPLEANRQNAKKFFVNYEVGVLELRETKTIYDTEQTDQMERNALSGASFGKSFKEIVCRNLSTDVYEMIVSSREGKKIQIEESAPYRELTPEPEAIDIAQLSSFGFTSLEQRKILLGKANFEPVIVDKLIFIADAIIERSALHAALILSAITERTGYGLKEPRERKKFGLDVTKGDALCLEGSVWKIEGYKEKVRKFWQKLVGLELNIDFLHEPDYNASLYGPIYMAATLYEITK